VGQLLNLSSLASDCGVSQPTARRWLSVLEASYIVFRLPPFWANVGKRLTKTPKLYFFDTGLVSSLLGIERPEQLETHPLRGSIFENWVVSEVTTQHRHRGKRPRLFFYRERGRLEIDVVIEHGSELVLIEAKAGQTPSSSYFSAFPIFEKRIEERKDSRWTVARRLVVYAGSESQSRSAGELVPWSELPALC
jgi:predicted AAA+ superfamily ATPase